MSELIKRLPSDISKKICNYIASPQSLELMKDVRNYVSLYEIITLSYADRVKAQTSGSQMNRSSDKLYEWFGNDLIRWANQNQLTIFGYKPHYYEILERIEPMWHSSMLPAIYYRLQYPTKKRPTSWYRIDCYTSRYYNKKTPKTKARIFWGLLKPSERCDFVKKNRKFVILSLFSPRRGRI
jgi:hypothetical protein